MKEVRSNMTIAVIIVYLSCHEEESSWRKIIRVLLFSASLNLRARCFLYGALCLFPDSFPQHSDQETIVFHGLEPIYETREKKAFIAR